MGNFPQQLCDKTFKKILKSIAEENFRMLYGLTGKDILGAFMFVRTNQESLIDHILIEPHMWHN